MSNPSLNGSGCNVRLKSFEFLLKARPKRVGLQPLQGFAYLRCGSTDLGKPKCVGMLPSRTGLQTPCPDARPQSLGSDSYVKP